MIITLYIALSKYSRNPLAASFKRSDLDNIYNKDAVEIWELPFKVKEPEPFYVEPTLTFNR